MRLSEPQYRKICHSLPFQKTTILGNFGIPLILRHIQSKWRIRKQRPTKEFDVLGVSYFGNEHTKGRMDESWLHFIRVANKVGGKQSGQLGQHRSQHRVNLTVDKEPTIWVIVSLGCFEAWTSKTKQHQWIERGFPASRLDFGFEMTKRLLGFWSQ